MAIHWYDKCLLSEQPLQGQTDGQSGHPYLHHPQLLIHHCHRHLGLTALPVGYLTPQLQNTDMIVHSSAPHQMGPKIKAYDEGVGWRIYVAAISHRVGTGAAHIVQ